MGKYDPEREFVSDAHEEMNAEQAKKAAEKSASEEEKKAAEAQKVDKHISDLTADMQELDKQLAIAQTKMDEIKEKMNQGAKVESGNPALQKIHASVQSELNNERLTWFDQVEQIKGQKAGAETALEYWNKVKRGEIAIPPVSE